jgi:hypothetical protein
MTINTIHASFISIAISVISDEKALSIFKAISDSEKNYDTGMLMTKLEFTRKQCYSRIEKLMQAKLKELAT